MRALLVGAGDVRTHLLEPLLDVTLLDLMNHNGGPWALDERPHADCVGNLAGPCL
jgi:hypothetical protein